MFVFTYLMANHFPWTYRYRDELAPDWRDLGNGDVNGHRIDEYLRRQDMSARDYKAFVERLKRDFPDEPFLIVRFGDHQPMFAKHIVDPALDDVAIGRRIDAADPRFFTTYYAIDALNFRPADLSSAVERPRCRLSAAGHSGGRGRAARCLVCRAEAYFPALQRPVLSLRQRRRGAPLQPAADRCRHDQAALTMSLEHSILGAARSRRSGVSAGSRLVCARRDCRDPSRGARLSCCGPSIGWFAPVAVPAVLGVPQLRLSRRCCARPGHRGGAVAGA